MPSSEKGKQQKRMRVSCQRCVLTLILVNVLLLIETAAAEVPDSEHVGHTDLAHTCLCRGGRRDVMERWKHKQEESSSRTVNGVIYLAGEPLKHANTSESPVSGQKAEQLSNAPTINTDHTPRGAMRAVRKLVSPFDVSSMASKITPPRFLLSKVQIIVGM